MALHCASPSVLFADPIVGMVPFVLASTSKDLAPAASATFIYNLLDFPAGTVPVTTVREDECKYECPSSQDDRFAAAARRAMQGSAGLPVGVQVVALPMQDEVALAVMGMLGEQVRFMRWVASMMAWEG